MSHDIEWWKHQWNLEAAKIEKALGLLDSIPFWEDPAVIKWVKKMRKTLVDEKSEAKSQ